MRILLQAIPLVSLLGCLSAHDPMPYPPDAQPDLDGGTDAEVKNIDAGIDGSARDATVDAEVDACLPSFPQCSASSGTSVACAELTCSGATPVCCHHADDVPASCVAAAADCTGSRDVTANIVDTCDDSDDCPAGKVCVDSYNKGLNHNDGADCRTVNDAYCGFVSGPPQGRWQRCGEDCECPLGAQCLNRICRAR